jgi:hypothetical protein
MIIYEVQIKVAKKSAGDFSKWLPEHIQRVLECPGMRLARKGRVEPGIADLESVIWLVQYEIDSDDAFAIYERDFAPALRAEAKNLFGDQLQVERRLINKVESITRQTGSDGLLMTDFPKVSCPYVRKVYPVDHAQWKKIGPRLGLKRPEVYLVTEEVNQGYEWVFDDDDTIAVEKLHGTNVKVLMDNGRIVTIQNRKNVIDPNLIGKGTNFIMDGLLQSAMRGWVSLNGEHAGELIGPKLQGNPYKLETHEWYPFEKTITELRYTSFNEHQRTFENLDNWFKDHLHSRLFVKRARKKGSDETIFAEGVIFYNLRRRAEKKSWMAKLRRDMYPWYYEGLDIKLNP